MGNCYSVDHIAEDHIHTDIICRIAVICVQIKQNGKTKTKPKKINK